MNNIEQIEATVLGSAIAEPGCAFVLFERIKSPNLFVSSKNKKVFSAIYTMYKQEQSIDEILVSEYLLGQKKLEAVGGPEYISGLCNSQVSPVVLEGYCASLYTKFNKRELNSALADIQKANDSGASDIGDLVQKTVQRLEAVQEEVVTDNFQLVGLSASVVVQEVEKAPEDKEVNWIDTKIESFNDLLGGGLEPSFQIWAARPGMGKTSFATSVAYNLADQEIPVAFFILEVSKLKFSMRILSIKSGIAYTKIKREMNRRPSTRPYMTTEEISKLGGHARTLGKLPLLVDDTTSYNIYDIKSRIISVVKKHSIRVVFIDYLGLIDRSNFLRTMNNDQAYGQVTRTLKNLSQSLNIPIIALHQLSRTVERETVQRPVLSSLRDSGNIEQDAEVVCFFYRPDYYDKNPVRSEKTGGGSLKGIGEVICAKHRDGATGINEVKFVKKLMQFTDSDFYLEKKKERLKKGQNELSFSMDDADVDEIPTSDDKDFDLF